MKYIFVFLFSQFNFIDFVHNEYKFLPNLPAGEYILYFKAILACKTIPNPDFQINLSLNKVSNNVTELRGNMTFNKPFDDSLGVNINLAVKDSIGGWKDNALLYNSSKACTTLKKLMGNMWAPYHRHFGIIDPSCPVPQGTYITKGVNLSNMISKSNFPKTLFYGMYKIRLNLVNDKANVIGCVTFVVNVNRPWEPI